MHYSQLLFKQNGYLIITSGYFSLYSLSIKSFLPMHLVNINVLVHNIKAKYFGKEYFNLITYNFWFWPVYIPGCVCIKVYIRT